MLFSRCRWCKCSKTFTTAALLIGMIRARSLSETPPNCPWPSFQTSKSLRLRLLTTWRLDHTISTSIIYCPNLMGSPEQVTSTLPIHRAPRYECHLLWWQSEACVSNRLAMNIGWARFRFLRPIQLVPSCLGSSCASLLLVPVRKCEHAGRNK